MIAIQHLPPRPRAVLILRDVLGWRARDMRRAAGDDRGGGQLGAAAGAGGAEGAPAGRARRVGGGRERRGARAGRALHGGVRGGRRVGARGADGRGLALHRCRPSRACTSAATRSSAAGSTGGFGDPTLGEFRCCLDAREPPARGRQLHPRAGRGRVRGAGARRAADRRAARSPRSSRSPTPRSRPSGCRRRCDVRRPRGRGRPRWRPAPTTRPSGATRSCVVRSGEIELRGVSGASARFGRGDLLWLDGVPLRALHNPGASPPCSSRCRVRVPGVKTRAGSGARRGGRGGRGAARAAASSR